MNRSPRRWLASGAAAAVTAAGLAVALPADAAVAEECPANQYCLYDNADFTKLIVSSDTPQVRWIGAANNDRVSAVVNNTTTLMHLYRHVNWDGFAGIVSPGEKRVLLSGENDMLSSYFLY